MTYIQWCFVNLYNAFWSIWNIYLLEVEYEGWLAICIFYSVSIQYPKHDKLFSIGWIIVRANFNGYRGCTSHWFYFCGQPLSQWHLNFHGTFISQPYFMFPYCCGLHANAWWRHQMETFSALLAISPVPGEFPAQRPVTRSFDAFFDLRPNKQLSWVNNGETGDLRRHRGHYDVIVMEWLFWG